MLNLHINGTNIDNQLKQFWELEEIPNVKDKILTSEEQFVETHFQNTYACNSEGRFVVKLPFYKSNSELGDSKPAAISRLLAMERKFKNNPDFEKQYKEFMNEYESLGHMSLVNSRSHTSKDPNFLPHHAVIKPSSTTTKLRVVFDACVCCKTTNGASLNSLLEVGPKLQRDIFEILLNFRIPRIVFTADIEKMYHQILVADEDQKYQQILWRNNSNENIRTYKLKTVTYGLASASFLATRCIKQIALDDKDNPNLSRVLQEDIYMYDLLSGADTPNNAISICKDIAHVLSTRGFHLRKWNSNSTEFLAQFSEHSSHVTRVEFSKDSNESSKVLGLFWNSSNDTFGFQPSLKLTSPLTKRRILSESSKIFDPLGLLSPCTVFMKIFYQKLWLTKTYWDSPIPQQLTEDWLKFQKAFNAINYLTVPRWGILTADNTVELQNSQLRFNSKYYIILLSQHSISKLLIKEQHIAHLHAGPTLLAHVLRQSHWIRPFFSCGIDYAGHVLIKCNKGRGTKSTKGYIALFVCLATKAVHIEAVGDLTTDSFIAALRRFSARRGAPRHIYSNNGTNFVGARRKLDEIRKLWLSLPTNEAISYYLSKSSIDWHFIPPSSPHFGGDVLSVPEELPSTSNHRDRWELLQNIKRGFWKKWSFEVISSLQPRKQWQDVQPNLKEDDIVLIKEEDSPGTWPMARVLQVHPGNDGLVRVATVKTQNSVLKRPVHKLHKLPIYPN
ncbi:integrase catalytic domain-containing protein [Trichonephila clavipes]|uniref:Integrase catalytic domain-containing protein n=1 Tax=Trichonephila clavipes TaxID=2585209 RepID=A0A8X7BKA3_TRICX|nr:integrase catalytic domain-containing protein [Trichonephila clavipes]